VRPRATARPRDEVLKLMEVNPRFTRTIRVLVEAGRDYP